MFLRMPAMKVATFVTNSFILAKIIQSTCQIVVVKFVKETRLAEIAQLAYRRSYEFEKKIQIAKMKT